MVWLGLARPRHAGTHAGLRLMTAIEAVGASGPARPARVRRRLTARAGARGVALKPPIRELWPHWPRQGGAPAMYATAGLSAAHPARQINRPAPPGICKPTPILASLCPYQELTPVPSSAPNARSGRVGRQGLEP